MNNLDIYNAVRRPPDQALKTIKGGRLSGYTDINPMWRLKSLTEQFGPCGFGWRYEITDQWLEKGGNDEIAAFTNINLYIKMGDEWSEAIPGTGGSSFVAKERSGLYTSDECYKMALTDAISVACKSLGFAADIYWDTDKSKYDKPAKVASAEPETKPRPKTITKKQALELFEAANGDKDVVREVLDIFDYKNSTDVEVDKLENIKRVIKDTFRAKAEPTPFE